MDEENCPGIFVNSVLTTFYIPAVLVFLNYTNSLYEFGKQTTYVEWVLIAAELLKYMLCHHWNYQEKSKSKKSTYKFDFRRIFEAFIILSLILFVFYFGAVILGASVFSEHYETFFFSLLMTILTALPCVLHVNLENVSTLFLSVFEGTDLHPYYFWNIRFTILGSWLGAVIIPLDWDRPYQKWPIPCCIGALCGCYVGNIFSIWGKWFFKKKTRKFNLCELFLYFHEF